MTEPFKLYNGNCLDVLRELPDNSIDSCVTDPPYGLSFMGKSWDYDVPKTEIWAEVYRVLKPGGHLLAFFGSRTYHRGVVQVEDAGFEIRDQIMWVYGSGFPKSHDISKDMDKMAGVERMVIGPAPYTRGKAKQSYSETRKVSYDYPPLPITEPATEDAKKWQGWGTALKPAHEPIVVARKPISEGSVAKNVLKYGTGAINIDECRVATDEDNRRNAKGGDNGLNGSDTFKIRERKAEEQVKHDGRFPANVIHDGSEEVLAQFDKAGNRKSCNSPSNAKPSGTILGGSRSQGAIYPGEQGSAARFFYCAKANKSDRDEGMTTPEQSIVTFQTGNGASGSPSSISEGRDTSYKNNHPTVKPTDLMCYLTRLVTPKDGVVLDPFMGSGTTGKACAREGFRFIGIELSEDYIKIAEQRISHAYNSRPNTLDDFLQ